MFKFYFALLIIIAALFGIGLWFKELPWFIRLPIAGVVVIPFAHYVWKNRHLL